MRHAIIVALIVIATLAARVSTAQADEPTLPYIRTFNCNDITVILPGARQQIAGTVHLNGTINSQAQSIELNFVWLDTRNGDLYYDVDPSGIVGTIALTSVTINNGTEYTYPVANPTTITCDEPTIVRIRDTGCEQSVVSINRLDLPDTITFNYEQDDDKPPFQLNAQVWPGRSTDTETWFKAEYPRAPEGSYRIASVTINGTTINTDNPYDIWCSAEPYPVAPSPEPTPELPPFAVRALTFTCEMSSVIVNRPKTDLPDTITLNYFQPDTGFPFSKTAQYFQAGSTDVETLYKATYSKLDAMQYSLVSVNISGNPYSLNPLRVTCVDTTPEPIIANILIDTPIIVGTTSFTGPLRLGTLGTNPEPVAEPMAEPTVAPTPEPTVEATQEPAPATQAEPTQETEPTPNPEPVVEDTEPTPQDDSNE